VIRGEDSNWKAPKGIPDDGKMAHMASAAVANNLVREDQDGDEILKAAVFVHSFAFGLICIC